MFTGDGKGRELDPVKREVEQVGFRIGHRLRPALAEERDTCSADLYRIISIQLSLNPAKAKADKLTFRRP